MIKMMFREGVKRVECEVRGDGEKRKKGKSLLFYKEFPPH
jgi:hypothetical protein